MEQTTRVIVGLGNPGRKYDANRHNIGFRVIEALAKRLNVGFEAPKGRYQAATTQDEHGPIVLIKPLTYMNLSGEALVAWSDDTKIALKASSDVPVEADLDPDQGRPVPLEVPAPGIRPLVVCDDLALPLGAVRLRARGRSGGQNGLASIIEELGGDVFPRMRLGIDGTEGKLQPEAWPDYVLGDFSDAEKPIVAELVDHACSALDHWLAHELDATVSRYNRRNRPIAESD